MSLAMAAMFATTAYAQVVATPPTPATSDTGSTTLPVQRTLTDTGGRKIDVTITEKAATAIRVRRTSDGKDYDLPLAKLSADDQTFVASVESATPVTPVTLGTTPVDPTAPHKLNYIPDPTSPNGKIRILLVAGTHDPSGNLAALQKAGFDVILMAPVKLRNSILTGDF